MQHSLCASYSSAGANQVPDVHAHVPKTVSRTYVRSCVRLYVRTCVRSFSENAVKVVRPHTYTRSRHDYLKFVGS